MADDGKDSDLGSLLKAEMKEKSLSMRKLGSLTGIDTATISRIANGKQQAKPEHLRLFAQHLGTPLDRLFRAAGYDVGTASADKPASPLHESVDSIQRVLLTNNFMEPQFTVDHVRKELLKYEQYALTDEGARTIRDGFRTKIDSVGGAGPFIEQLRDLHALFEQPATPPGRRAIAGSALLYFILSADIIPDYVFPFGYLDDAIAVQLTLDRLAEKAE